MKPQRRSTSNRTSSSRIPRHAAFDQSAQGPQLGGDGECIGPVQAQLALIDTGEAVGGQCLTAKAVAAAPISSANLASVLPAVQTGRDRHNRPRGHSPTDARSAPATRTRRVDGYAAGRGRRSAAHRGRRPQVRFPRPSAEAGHDHRVAPSASRRERSRFGALSGRVLMAPWSRRRTSSSASSRSSRPVSDAKGSDQKAGSDLRRSG